MASYLNIALSTHKTLTANTVDRVTFASGNNYDSVEIKNRDTAADIYFCLGATAPVVGADGTYIAQAGESVVIQNDWTGDEVRLISSAAAAYSVTGIDRTA